MHSGCPQEQFDKFFVKIVSLCYFRQSCQNCFLHIHRSSLLENFLGKSSKNSLVLGWIIFGLMFKNFWLCYQNCIPRVHRNGLTKMFFFWIKRSFPSFLVGSSKLYYTCPKEQFVPKKTFWKSFSKSFSDLDLKNFRNFVEVFSKFCREIFGRVLKTAIYVSIWTIRGFMVLWNKTFLSRFKEMIQKFSALCRKILCGFVKTTLYASRRRPWGWKIYLRKTLFFWFLDF